MTSLWVGLTYLNRGAVGILHSANWQVALFDYVLPFSLQKYSWHIFQNRITPLLTIFTNPSMGQDMTQGQFLSGVSMQSFLSPQLVASPRTQSALIFTHSWRENNWIHTVPKCISAMWNAIRLVQGLNSCRHVHFLWW